MHTCSRVVQKKNVKGNKVDSMSSSRGGDRQPESLLCLEEISISKDNIPPTQLHTPTVTTQVHQKVRAIATVLNGPQSSLIENRGPVVVKRMKTEKKAEAGKRTLVRGRLKPKTFGIARASAEKGATLAEKVQLRRGGSREKGVAKLSPLEG